MNQLDKLAHYSLYDTRVGNGANWNAYQTEQYFVSPMSGCTACGASPLDSIPWYLKVGLGAAAVYFLVKWAKKR